MGSTSHPEFNENTEGLDVVKAFSDRVRGKTVVVTGVNRSGIGFSTAEAFVRVYSIQFVMPGNLQLYRHQEVQVTSSLLVAACQGFSRVSMISGSVFPR